MWAWSLQDFNTLLCCPTHSLWKWLCQLIDLDSTTGLVVLYETTTIQGMEGAGPAAGASKMSTCITYILEHRPCRAPPTYDMAYRPIPVYLIVCHLSSGATHLVTHRPRCRDYGINRRHPLGSRSPFSLHKAPPMQEQSVHARSAWQTGSKFWKVEEPHDSSVAVESESKMIEHRYLASFLC